MAVSPGPGHRPGNQFPGKKAPGSFSKYTKGGKAGRTSYGDLLCILGFVIPAGILFLAYKIHTLLGILLETFMCYQMLAARSLKEESMKVYRN